MDLSSMLTGICVPLVAAIISGGVTWYGVHKTISYQVKNLEESDRLSKRPFITTCDETEENMSRIKVDLYTDGCSYCCLCKRSEVKKENLMEGSILWSIPNIYIYVTDNADCVFQSIVFNHERYNTRKPIVLRRNKAYVLDLSDYVFVDGGSLSEIVLNFDDLEDRDYYYTVMLTDDLRYRFKDFSHSDTSGDVVKRTVDYICPLKYSAKEMMHGMDEINDLNDTFFRNV